MSCGGRAVPLAARLALVATLAAAVAACTDAGVETRSADRLPPSTSAAADTAPPTTDDAATATTESTDDRETAPPTTGGSTDSTASSPPSTDEPGTAPGSGASPPDPAGGGEDPFSAGDPLFPELGSSTIDVQSYDVRLAYDPATEVINGSVTIAMASQPTDMIVLDAGEMRIAAVVADGTDVAFEHDGDELRIGPLTPAPTHAVEIRYRDQAQDAGSSPGLGVGWIATETGSYVLNEPDGAHSWLPSNDHPSDKAQWRFEITVPAGLTAVANGQLVEERAGSGTTTWVWEETDPMATYLVQLLTGEYTVVDGGVAGDVPLVHVALTTDVAQMQEYFEVTDDQIRFFEPLFGPYPLERYGLAITESFGGLAMETQGRSLFSREDLPGGRPGVVQHNLLS
ncbi:MAG: hypothetical protein H0W46_10330, partial [Acidimicrobiia bacterium]|nr:hypothetical protein [Acidimicrobiia bacterium]